ncbi:MAG: SLBB domain-containing protein [Candidatus Wallbacteria bacterium]|nr:SLBB domain-containing protein [Candidatus Wallbacteria bacterium]
MIKHGCLARTVFIQTLVWLVASASAVQGQVSPGQVDYGNPYGSPRLPQQQQQRSWQNYPSPYGANPDWSRPPLPTSTRSAAQMLVPSFPAEVPGAILPAPVPVIRETPGESASSVPGFGQPERTVPLSGAARTPTSTTGPKMPLGLLMDQDLPLFGHDFFRLRSLPPLEALNITIDPDYRLGPGDAMLVHVWGKLTDRMIPVEIDRQGRLALPNLGELLVLGLRYGDLETLLKTRFTEALKDVQVSATLTRLRTFQVYVSGEVAIPGPHAVNALATVFTALMASGGPTDRGSLRRVGLARGGKTVSEIDFYDMLLSGKQTADPRLEPGDLVFVPIVGSLAAASGMVKRPAVYELVPGDTLASLIGYAGGLSPSAYPGLIHVQRNQGAARRQLVDLRGNPEDWKARAREFKVADGDAVEVPTLSARVENAVVLAGNVERPGKYQWRKGMRVSGLIKLGQKLLPGTYTERAEILRTRVRPESLFYNDPMRAETARELLSVDLAAALAGNKAADIELCQLDELTVLNVRQVSPTPLVRVVGEVFHPGSYELAAGMRLRDLVFRAGSLTAKAHLARGEITRQVAGGGQRTLQVDLGKAMAGDDQANEALENFDVVSIQTDPNLLREVAVTVRGEVRHPGTYLFKPGEKVSDLLERAGGFTVQAYPLGAIFTRVSVREHQEALKGRFILEQRKLLAGEKANVARLPPEAKPISDPQATFEEAERLLARLATAPASGRISLHVDGGLRPLRGSADDVALENGDDLSVPQAPSEIVVAGEVFTDGSFLYEEGRRIVHYVEKAGGFTRRAMRGDLFVLRADGTSVSASQSRAASGGGWDGHHLGMSSARVNVLEMPAQRGDSIFVPPDFRIKRDTSGEVIDRVFKLAVSIGTLSSVFR